MEVGGNEFSSGKRFFHGETQVSGEVRFENECGTSVGYCRCSEFLVFMNSDNDHRTMEPRSAKLT